MNQPIKSDDKVKEKNFKVLSNLTSQDIPKVSAPPTKTPSKQNKISDSESKQDPSKKKDDSPTINCAIVGNIDILNQPFTVGIQKKGEDICFGGSATFKGFKFQNFIKNCSLTKDYNFIPKCIRDIVLSGITVTVTGNIKIPEKSKDKASEQNKNVNITIKLETNNGYIKLLTEKPIEENENKSFYWTIEYASKKQDQQKNTDNDSEIQVVTENDRGIKVSELISDFAKGVLKPIGLDLDTDSLPEFIKDFTITGFTATNKPPNDSKPSKANQDEPKEEFIDITIDTSLGSVEVQSPAPEEKPQNEIEDDSTKNSDKKTWSITYKTKNNKDEDLLDLDVLKIPVAGELVKTIDPTIKNTSINDFKVTVSSDKGLNITLGCKVFGTACDVTIPLSKPASTTTQQLQIQQNMLLKNSSPSGPAFNGTAVWKKFDKPITILILTIPKIGFGLDNDGNIAVLLDASLNVFPLTFSLNEAGIGVNVRKLTDINFYLSGFGISFDNGILSIAGGLSAGHDKNNNPQYSGMISIRFKDVGLTAIGQYTKIITGNKETASLCACFSLFAPIGGIPAFFVRGIAGGFGYNERLKHTTIEHVNDHFLVQAAMGTHSNNLDDLRKNVDEEEGQNFLAAGLKFTSFELIEGCMLVTASFKKDCELGILGLANISVPPKVNTNPIAYAQLAIKAYVKPLKGVFNVEAQLSNKSYILSQNCKLTGGFAAYAWFGDNEHSGDFVVTLGGYHPSYNKPAHYPAVPRLGLNWQVNNNLNINGEMYFAVTPSNLMAGGKLCATYTDGNLKAWFIAYADILMKWKPFTYDISIGILVGASCTIKVWFIQKTISVEMSADLRLWGPEVQGKVHVSLYIFSFTISFSEGDDHSKDTLNWEGFKKTFLVGPKNNGNLKNGVGQNLQNDSYDSDSDDILSISLSSIIGKTPKDIDIVSAHQFSISALSKIPECKDGKGIHVRPANCDISDSKIIINVENNGIQIYNSDNNKNDESSMFKCNDICQNIPAALWGNEPTDNLNGESLVKDQSCGKKLSIQRIKINLFPKNQFIRLSELYKDNIIHCWNSFVFSKDASWNLKDGDETIKIFKANEITSVSSTTENRKAFLKAHSISDEDIKDICLEEFATNADDLLSESILIINV